MSGKIDRIDFRSGGDGPPELRVLDYKTSAEGKPPSATHLSKTVPRRWAEKRRAMDIVTDKQKIETFYWCDLQLPLYLLLMRHVLQGTENIPRAEKFSAAYFNLPVELTGTGIATFRELEVPGALESAARCADEVLRLIFVDRIFWPPAAQRFDVFPDSGIAMTQFLDPTNWRSGS